MKRARPTALVRGGIAASLGLASAVLVPIACGVDTVPHAPPKVTTSAESSSGAGGAAGSSSASTGASVGVGPDSLCACTTAAFSPDSTCADCFHQVAGVDCATPVTACQKDPSCVALLIALDACHADAQCLADTLATHPGRNAYLDVLACVCVSCATSCVPEVNVGCDAGKSPIDAGNDADLDATTDGDAAGDAMIDAAIDAAEDAAIDAADAGDDAALDAADAGD